MSAIQRTVSEAEAELKKLRGFLDSVNRDLQDLRFKIEHNNRELQIRNKERVAAAKRAKPGLDALNAELLKTHATLTAQIATLEKFTSLSAEADRAIKVVQANTLAIDAAALTQSQRKSLSDQSLKILAEAERVKADRVLSTDADRLKEQLRVEQIKAEKILAGILDAAGQERARKEAEAAAIEANSAAAKKLKAEQELAAKQTTQKARIFELTDLYDAKTLDDLVAKMTAAQQTEKDKLDAELIKLFGNADDNITTNQTKEENLLDGFFSSLMSLGTGIGEALGNIQMPDLSSFAAAFKQANDVQVEDLVEAMKIQLLAAIRIRNDPEVQNLQKVLQSR